MDITKARYDALGIYESKKDLDGEIVPATKYFFTLDAFFSYEKPTQVDLEQAQFWHNFTLIQIFIVSFIFMPFIGLLVKEQTKNVLNGTTSNLRFSKVAKI